MRRKNDNYLAWLSESMVLVQAAANLNLEASFEGAAAAAASSRLMLLFCEEL